MKKLKDARPKIIKLASGSINLLEDLKKLQQSEMRIFHVEFKALNEEKIEICVQYEIEFRNPPIISSTLSASVSQIHNLPLDDGEQIECAFHFPVDDGKYQTVFLHPKTNLASNETDGFLTDELLTNIPLDQSPSKAKYYCENIQTEAGFEFLAHLITSHGKLLLEIRWRKKNFMSFINLEIFNYEGVEAADFLVPLYYYNKKVITDQFHQELHAFPEEEKLAKKGKEKRNSKKLEETIDADLVPLILEDKHVMMKIWLKIAQPLTSETPLEELKFFLNQEVPFVEEISIKDQIIKKSEKDFEYAVKKISRKMEEFIDDNPSFDSYDIQQKLKRMIENGELFDKKKFKEIVKNLIGNKLSVESRTETNHEFKVKILFI